MTKAADLFSKLVSEVLLTLVAIYRLIGSPALGGACRFEPSCSAYAVEALRKHSPWLAVKLIFVRLTKCRPGGPSGFDPVPENCHCRGHHESKK